MKTFLFSIILCLPIISSSQVLVDSIPLSDYGTNANFYGLDGEGDLLYLGSDFDGQIISFNTTSETEIQSFSSPYDFCHGLAKTSNGFYLLEDFSSAGALMYEIDEAGNELGTYDLPDGILGPPSGVGGLDLFNESVWFTVYYQDSDDYPYAYAYLWNPTETGFTDTVPMLGGQPHGIEQIGDLLVYVIDDNDGDLERLHGYDLVTGTDVFSIDLPDTQNDNDQSPRGLHFDGEYLWLIAKRAGPSAFAYNTLYKYDLSNIISSIEENALNTVSMYPNPSTGFVRLDLTSALAVNQVQIFDKTGKLVLDQNLMANQKSLEFDLATGIYTVTLMGEGGPVISKKLIVQ